MTISRVVLAAALAMILLPAGSAQSADKIVMLVGEWAVETLTPYTDEFTKSTGIEVDVQGLPFRDLLATIEVRAKAKADDVDVIFVDAPLVPSYAVRGVISSMSSYFADGEAASLWTPASIAAASWQGEMWAPPLENSSQLLFYNTDLLKAAGIEAPSSEPEKRITWEHLAENAKSIVNTNNGIWGFSFDQVSRYYQLQALPESLGGGSGIDESGLKVAGKLTNDSWLKAAKFYYDIFNTWAISPKGVSPEETQQLFASGKVGYFVGGPWNIGAFVAAGTPFGIALHPYFEGGVPVTATNSWHIGVFNYSKHKDEAAQLAKFLTASPAVAIDYVVKHGNFPAHLAALQYIKYDPKYAVFPNTGYALARYEAENTAVTRARTPAFLEFEELVNNAFEDIRNGGDPKEVLSETETRIESAIRRYQN